MTATINDGVMIEETAVTEIMSVPTIQIMDETGATGGTTIAIENVAETIMIIIIGITIDSVTIDVRAEAIIIIDSSRTIDTTIDAETRITGNVYLSSSSSSNSSSHVNHMFHWQMW